MRHPACARGGQGFTGAAPPTATEKLEMATRLYYLLQSVAADDLLPRKRVVGGLGERVAQAAWR